jgi:hypothetical protein
LIQLLSIVSQAADLIDVFDDSQVPDRAVNPPAEKLQGDTRRWVSP